MAKKLQTSKGNRSIAKATTTQSTGRQGVGAVTASSGTLTKQSPASSGPAYSSKQTVSPSVPTVSGQKVINPGSKDNVNTSGSKDTGYVGNYASKDISGNYASKDPYVTQQTALQRIQNEAQKQAEAGKQYVQNMLTQMQNSRPIQTANDFFSGISNPNASPMQKSNEMFNAVKNRTAVNNSYIPSNFGAGAGSGVNPLLLALLSQTGQYTPTEDRQYTTDRWTNEDDNFVDEWNQNAMIGDPRYAGTPNAMQGDRRYVGRTDAMLGDPRFRTNAGTNGSDAYQSLQNALEQNTRISTIENPDPTAAFIEAPAFMVDENAPRYNADGSENTTVVPMNYFDDYGTADLYAMRGDKRYEGVDLTDARKSLNHNETRPYSNPNFPFGTDTSSEDYANRMKGDGLLNTLLNERSKGDGDISVYGGNSSNGGKGGNGGSGRNGRNGSNGTSGGYIGGDGYLDISDLYDLLNQRLGEYDANYESLMQSLLDNYNLNFGNLDTAYLDALNRLGLNYADTEALLNGNLDTSRQALEDDRTRALQEAYISRMMQEKNLTDQLAAYGLSGGATESVMADLRNNYANNRANVEDKVQQSLRELLQTYMSNLSDARQRYNDSLLNAEQSRLNASQNLANQLIAAQNDAANYRSQQRAGAYEDLYNTLANLTMKGINYVS